MAISLHSTFKQRICTVKIYYTHTFLTRVMDGVASQKVEATDSKFIKETYNTLY